MKVDCVKNVSNFGDKFIIGHFGAERFKFSTYNTTQHDPSIMIV